MADDNQDFIISVQTAPTVSSPARSPSHNGSFNKPTPAPPIREPNYDHNVFMSSAQMEALMDLISHSDAVIHTSSHEDTDPPTLDAGDEGETNSLSNISWDTEDTRSAAPAVPPLQENEDAEPDSTEMRTLPRFTTLYFEEVQQNREKPSNQPRKQRQPKRPNATPSPNLPKKVAQKAIATQQKQKLAKSDSMGHASNTNISITADFCSLCDKQLPQPVQTQTIQIRKLKPRFLREIRRLHPLKPLPANARICIKDLHAVLETRIEMLLEEDQNQLAQLLEEAMKSIGEYEQQEPVWQKQFEVGASFGERAADSVAKFGGSWNFIGALIGFLAFWIGTNLILGKFAPDAAWDPFPFILLNLFLSSIASLQAPFIMMSQNRQSQIDRTQNSYISKIILRAEHQVRHVNAKVDHLLSHQWKRLLEIQEIEVSLLQGLQIQSRKLQETSMELGTPISKIPGAISRPSTWVVEIIRDDHARALLSLAYGAGKPEKKLMFSHWHTEGEGFPGVVSNVKVELKGVGLVKRITYSIKFEDVKATLDDILSGEGTVALRNDFDSKDLVQTGKIATVTIHRKDSKPVTYANGDLPPRYKSNFENYKRADRVSEFWKLPITQLIISYIPTYQGAALSLKANQTVRRIRVDFAQAVGFKSASLFRRMIPGALPVIQSNKTVQESSSSQYEIHDPLGHLRAITGPRPFTDEIWKKVATASWDDASSQQQQQPDSQTSSSVSLEAGPITVTLEEELKGPATYVFICDETKVAFHAIIEE
ncbi:hypothetical protein HDU97_008541 [Phlyctochytrium planicorne]|nr:hypothetical protein HDU97_008541 [Phlyctochytrium planicorne]